MATVLLAEPMAPRIPGWFNHGAKILELIERHRPKVCVELGTWQGASAIPVARSIQRWGGTLTCVDTWAGELNDDGGSAPGKVPVMLMTCARGLIEAGVSANVRLVPAMTVDAARYWSEPIDFLYVDADHGYEAVKADLLAWESHVKLGGLIVGDDYEHPRYPGVKRAWDEFEATSGIALTRYQSTPPMEGGVQIVYAIKSFRGGV
jgi:predicted O-methyltransferase YrrM